MNMSYQKKVALRMKIKEQRQARREENAHNLAVDGPQPGPSGKKLRQSVYNLNHNYKKKAKTLGMSLKEYAMAALNLINPRILEKKTAIIQEQKNHPRKTFFLDNEIFEEEKNVEGELGFITQDVPEYGPSSAHEKIKMPRGRKRALNQNGNDTNPKKLKVSHDSHGKVQGVVLTCGQGDVGQLGLGEDVMERTRLGFVDIPDPVTQVYAGGMHTLCLTNTGLVYSFGCNDEGALGRDTSEEGSETKPGKVNVPAPVVMVSAGDSHSAALTDDGRVYAWGNFRDANGSMGLTHNGIEKYPVEIIQEEVIVKVASGSDHLACLTDRGELLTLGCAEQGQLGRIAECFATRGGRKGLDMILNPGRVKVKRHKSRKLATFSDVWTGQYMTFAMDKDTEDIYAWGLNNYYQLGTGDMENKYTAERVASFSEMGSWAMISGGQHHTVALDKKGRVYTLGREDYGRLGLGENCGEQHTPTLVQALENKTCTNVCAGGCVSFAVASDGALYSWGMGSNNQLGTGDDDDQYTPVKVAGKQMESRSGVMVSSGGQHTVVLAKNMQNGVQH